MKVYFRMATVNEVDKPPLDDIANPLLVGVVRVLTRQEKSQQPVG